MRGSVKRRPTGGGKYRFWFLGMPMTFSKLQAHFGNKTTTFRLKAVWMRKHRPHQIDDPEFFAPAFTNYVREVEVVGVGTFPTAAAVARYFGVTPNLVGHRLRDLGTTLRPEDLQADQSRSERMRKAMEKKRIAAKKEQIAKRPKQTVPSDEWLSFSDRPRATQQGGFHTSY